MKITDISVTLLANPDLDPHACDSAQDAVLVEIATLWTRFADERQRLVRRLTRRGSSYGSATDAASSRQTDSQPTPGRRPPRRTSHDRPRRLTHKPLRGCAQTPRAAVG
jgi:hypothetical protein